MDVLIFGLAKFENYSKNYKTNVLVNTYIGIHYLYRGGL